MTYFQSFPLCLPGFIVKCVYELLAASVRYSSLFLFLGVSSAKQACFDTELRKSPTSSSVFAVETYAVVQYGEYSTSAREFVLERLHKRPASVRLQSCLRGLGTSKRYDIHDRSRQQIWCIDQECHAIGWEMLPMYDDERDFGDRLKRMRKSYRCERQPPL